MKKLKYLSGYSTELIEQVERLIDSGKLVTYIEETYPLKHEISTDKALYNYTMDIKSSSLKKSQPISRVLFDPKLQVVNHALGTHTFVSRVQGSKLKAKNEIRISAIFKDCPAPFLRMIVVHELAHLKEKDHNKAFYRLCVYMEPQYARLELDMRLFLTLKDLKND